MSTKLKPIQVSIRNFQSISELDFEVHGFTCITGKSNIGKSAIARAISGAILNIPVGGMVRRGAKFCSVTLQSDGWGFKWEKGGGASRYFVPSDADKPLDKVGAGQIEPIAEMGFQSVKLGREEAHPWYANQFEPIFLLNQTGSTVTDFISEVSRLQVLQDAIQISIRGRKKAMDEVKIRSSDIAVIREKLSKVDNLDALERLAKELEEQAESIREYERKILFGETLTQKLASGRAVLLAVEKISSVKIPKDDADPKFKQLKSMHVHHRGLMSAAQRVIALKGVDKVMVPEIPRDELDKLSKARNLNNRLTKLAASVKALSGKIKIPDEPPSLRALNQMIAVDSKINTTKSQLNTAEVNLKDAQAKLALVQSELDLIPTCPTCGRPSGSDGIVPKNKKQSKREHIHS